MELHTLEPFYDNSSEILILGSFPSFKSREQGFYYAHKQNRFWQVLAKIYNEDINDIASKKAFLTRNKIALFDVCAACEIVGSKDATIKNVVANDIEFLLKKTKIKNIYVNGKTAFNLYNKLIKDKVGKEAIYLPSTSAANASFSLEALVEAYQIIKKDG